MLTRRSTVCRDETTGCRSVEAQSRRATRAIDAFFSSSVSEHATTTDLPRVTSVVDHQVMDLVTSSILLASHLVASPSPYRRGHPSHGSLRPDPVSRDPPAQHSGTLVAPCCTER